MLAPADRECFHTGLPMLLALRTLVSSGLQLMFGLVDLEARTQRVVFAPVDNTGLFGLDDDDPLPVGYTTHYKDFSTKSRH